MTMQPGDDLLSDLLVKDATEALDADEAAELARLLSTRPAEREVYARTVAELDLLAHGAAPALPEALARRLTAVGEAYVGGVTPLHPAPSPRARHRAHTGWYVAAASILVALTAWYPRVVETPTRPATVRSAALEARLARESLLAKPGVLRTSFSGTADAAGAPVEGDVVWDPGTQRGYLRLKGLPANDPHQTQYQLWVFDAARDPKYPVDGGVFDVTSTGIETLVPIRVPLKVGQVVLFAVTVEQPGGVVVSGREHIVATAKPAAT